MARVAANTLAGLNEFLARPRNAGAPGGDSEAPMTVWPNTTSLTLIAGMPVDEGPFAWSAKTVPGHSSGV